MKYIRIPLDQAQKLIDYLGNRPCKEVFDHVLSLKNCPILEEEEKKEEDTDVTTPEP